ncbi:helix-turn-helix domain-containing protein [Alteromonas sp. a30]|uniref:helix-turn-helix domain-containing protein n=1 Tax=Alteromonas sp. a30 TaxID=2730917 RepID=UPI002282C008|nr:helix-turn-helix transcriptional regulator [Alteromonas sp. a30]MCY7295046.1 helix-turn-helix transcriptional regulator [Alteromonas sp. a30]
MRFISGGDLRAMRTVSGLTTMQMAAAAGVKTRKTYENWEKNLGTPNVNQFIAMATHCGLKPSEFIANFEIDINVAWKNYSKKTERLAPKMTDKKRWFLERALHERMTCENAKAEAGIEAEVTAKIEGITATSSGEAER